MASPNSGADAGGAAPRPPLDDPRFLPILPFIYLAWSDGTLTVAEVAAIRQRLQQVGWLDAGARAAVARWLDPARPPTPQEYGRLLEAVRESATRASATSSASLTDLGVRLARSAAGAADADPAVTAAALSTIEQAFGVAGRDAVRLILTAESPPDAVPRVSAPPPFDVARMARVLDGPRRETRQRIRTLLREPLFRHRHGLTRGDRRALVWRWCRRLADEGLGALSYPAEYGGGGDLGAFVAAFETLAFFDVSLVIKFGVQFGLFGGSVLNLGTAAHHRAYLPAIGRLALSGCFAMTETGHGSNVRDLETVARYDPGSDELIIRTPSESARKDYIGNAAADGRMATVFAQLDVAGERHGVHAILVPIRQDDGSPVPGVRIEDCGEKVGLNGVDNGRLWFDDVRVPRANLLDRFGRVSADGVYSSDIPNPSRRFFTMIGTLVGGRVSLAAAAVSAAKSALTIAVRYGDTRRQFGPPGAPEWSILDYRTHQRRLMPRLAWVYALNAAVHALTERYARTHRASDDPGAGGAAPDGADDGAESRELEGLAAGLKAYGSWANLDIIQTCREACGGQGYLSENRLGDLRADTDIFATFEGDNTVLLQLVAKGRLTEFRQTMSDLTAWGLVRFLASQAAGVVAERNPIVTRRTDESHLRDPEFHLGLFKAREAELLVSAARRLKQRIDDGMGSFEAMVECQDHLVLLATAYVERSVLESCQEAAAAADPAVTTVLRELGDLFALWRIERDRGWFLEEGYLEPDKAKAIRTLINAMCRELRPHARGLVDAFAIPDEALGAPIATGPGSPA